MSEKNNEFKIDFNWLDREHGTNLDKTTFAEISLEIAGNAASEVHDRFSKTTRDGFRASAFDLAFWLACNWWRLRWETLRESSDWEMSHQLSAIGNGYVWPDITLYCDGKTMNVKSVKTQGNKIEPIRFLADFITEIDINLFESEVDNFISSILARLNQRNLNENELYAVWKEVLRERSEPKIYNWRKLEAILGFDPDEGPEDLIQALIEKSSFLGQGAVEEICSATQLQAVETLEKLQLSTQDDTKCAEIPYFNKLRERLSKELRSQDLPWQQGEYVAGMMRETLSLGLNPIQDEALNDLFSLPSQVIGSEANKEHYSISAGYRVGSLKNKINVFLPIRFKTGRRFALLRIIGDHLRYDTSDKLLAATDSKTARQRFQRAFAIEFLSPFKGLTNFLGGEPLTGLKIEEAAEYFGVSPLAVTSTLVNKGLLDRSSLWQWDCCYR